MFPLWFLFAGTSSSCTIPRMENAPENIDVAEALGDLDEVPATPTVKRKRPRAEAPSDEARRKMHASFNDRISYLCKLAALVIAVVALATIALGQEMPRFVLMGLCVSVALLAIAMLQDHHQRKQ